VLFWIELDAVYSVLVVVGSGLAKDERGSFVWPEMEALGDTAKERTTAKAPQSAASMSVNVSFQELGGCMLCWMRGKDGPVGRRGMRPLPHENPLPSPNTRLRMPYSLPCYIRCQQGPIKTPASHHSSCHVSKSVP